MKPPIFDGLPSPSLKKMQRMRPHELQRHLKTMEQERLWVVARLERLEKTQKVESHDRRVRQEARLRRLIEAGQRMLVQGQFTGYQGAGGGPQQPSQPPTPSSPPRRRRRGES